MKRIALFVCLMLMFSGYLAEAATVGTMTCTVSERIQVDARTQALSIVCSGVADVSAGTFPNKAITLADYNAAVAGWWLYQLDVDPGNSTVPSAPTVKVYRTADYTANTTNALSLCTASAVSTTLTSATNCGATSAGYFWPGETLTLVTSQAGNTPNSATLDITLRFRMQ